MEEFNSFQGGMNMDNSPLNQPKGTYVRADNLRIINDASLTSGSINNIKGNQFNLTIPNTTTIQKIDITGVDASQTITINGETGTALSIGSGTIGQDIKDYIDDDAAYTKYNVEYTISAATSYILVIPVTGFPLTIAFGGGDTGLTLNTSYVPAQTDLEIIGFTTIRDDIYLFTTNNTTKNPGGYSFDTSLPVDPSSVGQIWKYTYDKITLSGTLTLIYNNYIDFSTYYAIPPSAALGRYENTNIQRLYWTDNFNKLRSLNVSNPNVLALEPSLLDIVPAVDFDIPILQSIFNASGNNTPVGSYQVAYRLKNTGGAVTNFSELSNMVFVVGANEASNTFGNGFKDYIGAGIGSPAGKQITWRIENLDTDFERIEVVVIRKDSPDDSGDLFLLDDVPLNGEDFYEFTYDGTQTYTPLTLTEFAALQGTFTHCKTIATKDNRLFAANIRNQSGDLEFDCRAFRKFTGTVIADDIILTNNGSSSTYTSATAQALDETEDAINDYSDVTKACFYKPGSSVANILGGSGLNVSYEFYTIAIAADRESSAGNTFNVADFSPAPWRSTNPRYWGTTDINLGVTSPTNNLGTFLQEYSPAYTNINSGFKYPHISGLLRGYQRNEIYRFGIQFYDKSKNPYFVKWIGDIKFPDFWDLNNNSFYEDGSSTSISDFRASFTANKSGSYSECFVQSLGITFTIDNLETISDKISGYSIVRVERTEEDKTIVAQGYLTRSALTNYGGMDDQFYTTSLTSQTDGNAIHASSTLNNDKGFFITPNFVDGSLAQPSDSMILKVKNVVDAANTDTSIDLGGTDPYYMFKYYDCTDPANSTDYNIDQISYIGYDGAVVDNSTGKTVHNYDYDVATNNPTLSHSMGNPALYYKVDTGIDFTPLGGNAHGVGSQGKLVCNIETILTDQYGGNTYSDRADNIYIQCNHFRPIRLTSTPFTDTFEVFGGDIFMNMYDSCRWSKNWGGTSRGVAASGKFFAVFFIALECEANTDLRHGVYVNKNISTSYESSGSEFVETYDYNPVYSNENKIKSFFPRPDPFTPNNEFDTRVHASEIKINGELIDNWGVFKPGEYWDVEGSYGPINSMTPLNAKMYFWQDRAFGTLAISPRVVIQDTQNGTDLQLGVGDVLQRHDYISTEVGCQHQWGITKSSYKLFWMDVNLKKFYAYGEGQAITPDSDIKGMFSWFSNNLKYNITNVDKPTYLDGGTTAIGLNGIRSVYDFKYNQAIFTISDSRNTGVGQSGGINYTFTFDERLNAFVSFYSYTPRIYFTDGYKIFSTNPVNLNDIYIHDEGDYCNFYTVVYSSVLKLVVNPNPQYTKVFDNLMWDSQATQLNTIFNVYVNYNDSTWNSIRIYDDYQNTDTQTLTLGTNIRRRERTWQLAIPRNRVLYTGTNSPNIFNPTQLSSPLNKSFGERIRDKYIVVELTYNNTSNYLLSTNNIRSLYRISPR